MFLLSLLCILRVPCFAGPLTSRFDYGKIEYLPGPACRSSLVFLVFLARKFGTELKKELDLLKVHGTLPRVSRFQLHDVDESQGSRTASVVACST